MQSTGGTKKRHDWIIDVLCDEKSGMHTLVFNSNDFDRQTQRVYPSIAMTLTTKLNAIETA